MASSPTAAPLLFWLTPALLALLLYGLGQGFVKMWITEVPPARFCLYFAFARAVVMICYFFANPHVPVFAAENRRVLAIGVLAYLLDGAGWRLLDDTKSAVWTKEGWVAPRPTQGDLEDGYLFAYGHDYAGARLHHRRGRRRTAGDRHSAAAGCGGLGV